MTSGKKIFGDHCQALDRPDNPDRYRIASLSQPTKQGYNTWAIKGTDQETKMAEIVFLVEDAPEGGFTAKALGYSIYTEADTWAELRAMIHDALACHFDEDQKPRVARLHYLREEVMVV
jgi:hypothetical protein